MGDARTKWLLQDRQHTYLTIATATCLIYDHFTTLADEIELIWKRPGHIFVKALFAITRYVGTASQIYSSYVVLAHMLYSTNKLWAHFFDAVFIDNDMITGSGDNLLYRILGYLMMIPMFAMQGIMIFRISSMYRHNRKIILLLVAGFSMQVMSALAMKIVFDLDSVPVPDPIPGIHLCFETPRARWVYLIIVPFVSFEFLLLVTSLSGAVHYYKSQIRMKWTFHGRGSLINILFRDSITFPFINLMLLVVYLYALAHSRIVLGQFAFIISLFWPGIAGPRLILNLREAYYQPFERECNIVHDNFGQLGTLSS